MGILKRYSVGVDFTEEQFHKWWDQLTWWIGDSAPNTKDPKEHAKRILAAAMNGTKIDGTMWNLVPNDFFKRVKVLAGFDLETGIGTRKGRRRKPLYTNIPKTDLDDLPPTDLKSFKEEEKKYKEELVLKYPHLENPVYKPKVDELAETIIKSRMLSHDFITASGKHLENLSKIRESLHKQIDELMALLEISPKQLLAKKRDADQADLGSLIAQLESYGKLWQDYERLDALRELLQTYHQLQANGLDGKPQLLAWELWHRTRSRPVHFKCRCGAEYDLLGGFTPEEIEQALKQAYEVYGFGLQGIEQEILDTGKINDEIVSGSPNFDLLTFEQEESSETVDPEIDDE